MAGQENVAAVRDFIECAWNAGDEAVFEEHLAADFGADDKVVTRWTMHGTTVASSAASLRPAGRSRSAASPST